MPDGRRPAPSRQSVLLHDPSAAEDGPAATSATSRSTLQQLRRGAPTWLAVLASLAIGLVAGQAASTLFAPVGGAALEGLWIDPPSPAATMASSFEADDGDEVPATPSATPSPETVTTEPAGIVGPTGGSGQAVPGSPPAPGTPAVVVPRPSSPDIGSTDLGDRPPVRPDRPAEDDDLNDDLNDDRDEQGEDHQGAEQPDDADEPGPSDHAGDPPTAPDEHDRPEIAEDEEDDPAGEAEEPQQEPEDDGEDDHGRPEAGGQQGQDDDGVSDLEAPDGHSDTEEGESEDDPEPPDED